MYQGDQAKLGVWPFWPAIFAYRSQETGPPEALAAAGPPGRSPPISNRIALSPNESYPQHVVTAVIVAHDGVTWLPQVADAVLGQTRPVQRVVAVDTGSRDRSGAVLASKFGQAAVFGMDRTTGYGAAIARALQHRAAKAPVPAASGGSGESSHRGSTAGGQAGERTEWLWLLHDDCEPAPDALEQLLRGTVETSSAAVLGPKIRDWSSRDVILEAGVTVDTATRRVTGIEPREVDQGQHDGDRDALAVSSAGMLVRRDVWEQVGGFDTAMGLFMEDIDFCWRVHAAGYRVRVITDAVVYHARAATKHKRAVSVGRRARMLDRRNGLLTLLGNLPMRPMLTAAAGNVVVSLLRVAFFLLAKRLAAAMDELAALASVLCHPIRLLKMRRRRSHGRRAAYSRVRADLPPGHSGRRLAEFVLAALSRSQADTSGSHHATDDPTDDDSMLVDNGLGKRLLSSPALFTFVLLTGISLAACRSLIGSGPLGGGSLVPAWGGSGSLWASYVQTFHPSGIGSTTSAPPWLAVIAALATVLGGKPWLAIDVILIGCVPLSGLTAMFAVRKITTSGLIRVWSSVAYALLPVAMGVIAAGRFGTAVAFVLLPLIVAQAVRMVSQSGPRATRAAWATGLLVAIGAAFVPLLWVIALLSCVLAAVVFRATRRGLPRNLAIAALTAPVLLMPWTLTLISSPANLLLEAGLPQSGAPAFSLPARSLLLLSPGGPGLPPYWVTGGLLVVAFAALFAGRRRRLVVGGWGVALSGLLAGVVVSHLIVRPADGTPVTVWAGLPLALAAIGLLMAAAAAADGLGRQPAGAAGTPAWRAVLGGRGPWPALLGLVALSAPVMGAVFWLGSGVGGPVHQVSGPVVPELVAAAGGHGRQVRTLVLRYSGGHVSYLLLRGPSPSLADSALTPPADAQRALGKVVSALTTPGGSLAADQAQLLAQFDIGYVLAQAPVDPQLATELNDVSGLRPYSTTGRYSLWQLDTLPARVTVREPDGTVVPVASGAIGVAGVAAPAAGGTLMLAEPAGSWSASENGHSLAAIPSPAGSWAQAFRLPKGGGTLTVGHPGLTRDLLLLAELLAFLIVAALALPGIHVAEPEDAATMTGERAGGRTAARAAGRGGSGNQARPAAAAGSARGRGSAGPGPAVADPAGARTAVMDPAGRDDAGLTGADVDGAGTGWAGAGMAVAGLAGAGIGQAGGGLASGGRDDGGDGDDDGEAGQDVAAGRRGLGRAGLGRSQQGGRGTRGRGRNAARQRTGLTRGSRAAMATTGADASDVDAAGEPETTMLAGSPRAGRRGSGGRGLGGRAGDREDRVTDARPYGAGADRGDGQLADAWPYNTGGQERGADLDYGVGFDNGAGAGRAYGSGRGYGDADLTGSQGRAGGGRSGGGRGRPGDRLADAWPYTGSDGELELGGGRGGGESRSPGQHAFPGSTDPLGGSSSGRHGYRADEDLTAGPARRDRLAGPPGRAWSYPDEAEDDFGGRGTGADRGMAGYGDRAPGGEREHGPAGSAADWRSPSGRSPSGRSPGGDWPYPELDAPAGRDGAAGGRSPSGHAPDDSWPGRDASFAGPGSRPGPGADEALPPWRSEQGTRAYRLSGPGQAGSASRSAAGAGRDPDGPPSQTGPQRAVEPRGGSSGGRRDRRAGGRHGAGRPDTPSRWGSGRSRDAGDRDRGDADTGDWNTGPGPSWPGAGHDELEPLPPLDGPRHGQGGGPARGGSRRPGEDAGDWGRFDDEAADQGWNRTSTRYEPEYEGDSW